MKRYFFLFDQKSLTFPLLKPSQNKKGQVHHFWCLFLQLAAEKKVLPFLFWNSFRDFLICQTDFEEDISKSSILEFKHLYSPSTTKPFLISIVSKKIVYHWTFCSNCTYLNSSPKYPNKYLVTLKFNIICAYLVECTNKLS